MKRALSALNLFFFFLLASPVWSAAPAASVIGVKGTASVQRSSGKKKVLALKSKLFNRDIVTTEQRSKARLKFSDGGLVTLRSSSRLVIEDFRYTEGNPDGDSALINLVKGGMRAVTGKIGRQGKSDAYQAKNFAATIGIRGTEYVLRLCGLSVGDCNDLDVEASQRGPTGEPLSGLYFTVLKGSIAVTNATGTYVYSAVQHGYVHDYNTPPEQLSYDPQLWQEYEIFSRLLNCSDPEAGCLVR